MRNDDRRSQSPATRRNGTLQSCEPCRRSKQRCDHDRPVCRRCAAKRISDKCFYHPAPMTRRRPSDPANPAIVSSRLTSQPTSKYAPLATNHRLNANVGNSASSPGTLGSGRLFAPLEPPSALPGYLGSTSFSAVLTEHRNEIPFELEENTDSSAGLVVEPDRLQSGVDVLRFLYNFKVRHALIEKFYLRTWNTVVPKLVIDEILRSVRVIFDNFNTTDPTAQLQELAMQIFQNTARPMRTHKSMTAEEYCASFTGRNLRWEALGSIFTLCGMQVVITPDRDPEITQGSDDPRAKDKLLEQVTVVSTICLGFCDQASSVNELLAILQFNDTMLRTQQYGDSSTVFPFCNICSLSTH